VAGLAGGIISVGVIRHEFTTNKFENILLDSSVMLVGALVLLLIAGLLEVFITPLVF